MDPEQREQIVPRAAVRESVRMQGNVTRDEQLARQLIEQVDRVGYEEALERVTQESIDESKIEQQAQSIYLERDEYDQVRGTKLNREQKEKQESIQAQGRVINTFLERGFDNLGTDDRNRLIEIVKTEASRHPFLQQYFDGLPGNREKNEFARRILRDPNFVSQGYEYFKSLTERELPDLVSEAEERRDETQIEYDQVKGVADDLINSREQIERRNKRFERKKNGEPLQHADLAREIDRLRNNRNQNLVQKTQEEAEISRLDQEIRRLQNELNSAANARNPQNVGDPAQIRQSLHDTEGNRRDALKRLRDAEAEIKKLEDLEREERELPQQLVDAREREAEKVAQRNRLKKKLERQKREFEQAVQVQLAQENNLVEDYKTFFNRIANETFREDLKKFNDAFDKKLQEAEEGAPDKQSKKFLQELQEEYLRQPVERKRGFPGLRRTERFRPINREHVGEHFDALIEQGPDAVAKQILAGKENPATEKPYTSEEIESFVSSESFVSEVQPHLIKQLLAKKLQTTGMTKEDIYHITDSSWGQGMIEQARAHNKEFRDAVEKVAGEGALQGKNFWEKYRQYAHQHPFLFLLLLGIPGVIAGATMPQSDETIYDSSP